MIGASIDILLTCVFLWSAGGVVLVRMADFLVANFDTRCQGVKRIWVLFSIPFSVSDQLCQECSCSVNHIMSTQTARGNESSCSRRVLASCQNGGNEIHHRRYALIETSHESHHESHNVVCIAFICKSISVCINRL